MKKNLYEEAKEEVLQYYAKAGVVLTEVEKDQLEVADFGLGDWRNIGLNLVTFVNTERCCAKEMVLLPGQTCPEHRHAPIPNLGYVGKEETFRCRYGTVYLNVEGDKSSSPKSRRPEGYEDSYTVMHEVVLHAGEQYTILPNILHWFQAGDEGAVISEFSTRSLDEYDIFTDRHISRVPRVE